MKYLLDEEEYAGLKSNADSGKKYADVKIKATQYILENGCPKEKGMGYCDDCVIGHLSVHDFLGDNNCLAGKYMEYSK